MKTTQSQPPAAGQAAHTPINWKATTKRNGLGKIVHIIVSEQPHTVREVAEMTWLPGFHKENAADAAFIVRACNGFDSLVAALEMAENNLTAAHAHLLALHSRNIDRSGATNALIDSTLESTAEARAALQAAKE